MLLFFIIISFTFILFYGYERIRYSAADIKEMKAFDAECKDLAGRIYD